MKPNEQPPHGATNPTRQQVCCLLCGKDTDDWYAMCEDCQGDELPPENQQTVSLEDLSYEENWDIEE